MWCFTTIGFHSAVLDNQKKGHMLVRFRDPAHARAFVAAAYPKAADRPEIRVTPPPADYRWKVSLPHADYAATVARLAADVDYTNFKGACHRIHPDPYKGSDLSRVWGVMHERQCTITRGAARPVPAWEDREPSQGPPLPLQWRDNDLDDLPVTAGDHGRKAPAERKKHELWLLKPGNSRLILDRTTSGLGPAVKHAKQKLLTEQGIEAEFRCKKEPNGTRVHRIK